MGATETFVSSHIEQIGSKEKSLNPPLCVCVHVRVNPDRLVTCPGHSMVGQALVHQQHWKE